MNQIPKLGAVVQAPKMYDWNTPTNSFVGTRANVDASTWKRVPPSTGDGQPVGNVSWDQSYTKMVDSVPKIEVTATVEITNVDTDTLNNAVGLKPFPLNSSIKTCTVTLNNGEWVSSPQDTIQYLQLNSNPHNLALISPASETDDYTSIKRDSMNNPYATGTDTNDSIKSRGFGCNFPVDSINIDKASNKATFTFTFTEALCARPFQYNDMVNPQPMNDLRIYKIVNDFNFIPSSLIGLGQEVAAKGGVLNVNITAINYKLVLRNWDQSLALPQVPSTLVYSSPKVRRLANIVQTLPLPTSGLTFDFSTGSTIRTTSIPSMLAISVKKVVSTTGLDQFYPTPFAVIKNVSINCNTVDKLLSTLNIEQLYELSASNGYNKRFATFSGQHVNKLDAGAVTPNYGIGTVLFIRPSDIGIGYESLANASVPLNLDVNLSVAINDTPGAGNTYKYQMEIFELVDNFTYQFSNKEFDDANPTRSPDELLESKIEFTSENDKLSHVMGGSVTGDVWNALTSPTAKVVSKALRNTLPVVKDFASDGTPLGAIASSVGYGKKTGRKSTKGGELYRVGQGVKGGAKLSAADLKRYRNM